MKIDISNGEWLDKLTILEIKLNKMADKNKLENIQTEMSSLMQAGFESDVDVVALMESKECANLRIVNFALWGVEDKLRILESKSEFEMEFKELARSVYILNDQRADIKRHINEQTDSLLIEEKEYADYDKGKLNEESSN